MALYITQLRADHLPEPMGLVTLPSFSWKIDSDRLEVEQTAWRVQIAKDKEFDEILLDTDDVESAQSVGVRVEGLALESALRYWWRVWVEAGGEEAWSQPASFVSGLTEGFTARMITAQTDADVHSSAVTALQGAFTVDGEVQEAYAYASALGVYHLSLDGQRVDETEMAPGWTSYFKRLQYQTIDLTDMLKPGDHTLLGEVGEGWYKGEMGFIPRSNNYGDRTAFLCEVVIRYKEGRVQHVVTDEAWTAFDTPTSFASIYHGETCDGRLQLHNPRPARIEDWNMHTLIPQCGCAARVIQTIPVKEIIHTPKGETVVDFGQNMTGFVSITVSGPEGAEAAFQCFEVLDAQGNVYTANLRTARQTLRYTLSGRGEEAWAPRFSFQGFRYLHILSWPGEVRPEQFTACVVHSAMEPTATFFTSDKLINGLWHNILWGLKGNFLDIPTDCPQRDERLGWTGDAEIFSATSAILMNVYPFFSKWLKDLSADQLPDGSVPHVVPDVITPIAHTIPGWISNHGSCAATAWADSAVIIPWNMYVAYGDPEILRRQYQSMKAWVDFMHQHVDDDVWDFSRQFGDWVALDAAEGSYLGATPNELTCWAYYAHSTNLFAKACRALGKDDEAAEYTARYNAIVARFREKFFTPDGDLTARTQTAHILALHFHLVPDKWRAKTMATLKDLLAEHDGHLVTGFVGTPYFPHVLSDNGDVTAAYDLVMKKDFPSWLYQVEAGATTVWEHWDGLKPDGSMWSPDMNSFNHYAYGAVGEWLFRVLAGIRPDETDPGYHTVRFTPRPGGGIAHVNAALDTPYGIAAITWQEKNGMVEAAVTVPCNARGVLEVDGIALDDTFEEKNGLLTAEFGSGSYLYTWRIK